MEFFRKHEKVLKILIAISSLALILSAILTPLLAGGIIGQ